MDNEKPDDTEPTDDDQTVDEFKDEVENDPSTAKPDEPGSDDLDRLRGG
jgi:hypothetical protein